MLVYYIKWKGFNTYIIEKLNPFKHKKKKTNDLMDQLGVKYRLKSMDSSHISSNIIRSNWKSTQAEAETAQIPQHLGVDIQCCFVSCAQFRSPTIIVQGEVTARFRILLDRLTGVVETLLASPYLPSCFNKKASMLMMFEFLINPLCLFTFMWLTHQWMNSEVSIENYRIYQIGHLNLSIHAYSST